MDWDLSRKIVLKRTNSTENWTSKIQSDFLSQLGELLKTGMNLKDSLSLMTFLLPKHKKNIQQMLTDLGKGSRFDEVLSYGHFSDSVRSQLYLAMQNGSLADTCILVGNYLQKKHQQLQKLRQVLLYPFLLIVLLIVMMLLIRYLLLEQLRELVTMEVLQQHIVLYVIWVGFVNLPQILIGSTLFCMLLFMLLRYYWKKQEAITQVHLLETLPVIGKLVRQYYTFLYAREFAYFLGQSNSVLQLVNQMQQIGTTSLTKSIACLLNDQLVLGKSFEEALQALNLFEETLCLLMIEGTFTNQLDVKLQQFSKYTFQKFQTTIERKITLVQPILFLGIGSVIMAMYAILLLPTLTMIGGN